MVDMVPILSLLALGVIFLVGAAASRWSAFLVGAVGADGGGRNGLVRVAHTKRLLTAPTWTQLGPDLVGGAPTDTFGFSVSSSFDGSVVAVGDPYHEWNGRAGVGSVKVFELEGSSWTQLGSELVGGMANDWFGRAVALSDDGTRLAVGVAGCNANGIVNSGRVIVYSFDGSAWNQMGSVINGETEKDRFGWSVALDGNGTRFVAGALYNDGIGTMNGNARIFQFDGSDWVQLGSNINGEAIGDRFGYAVAMSNDGSTVAVGADRNDGNGNSAGHVRVYEWNGSSWTQLGNDLDGEVTADGFGGALSLAKNGAMLAVGAQHHDSDSLVDAGSVQIYEWDGSSWNQKGPNLLGESAYDLFGFSVSLDQDGLGLAVGAKGYRGVGANSGLVLMYRWDGSQWKQFGNSIDGKAAGDSFGSSVCLSGDGNRVSAGAPGNYGSIRNFEAPITQKPTAFPSSAPSNELTAGPSASPVPSMTPSVFLSPKPSMDASSLPSAIPSTDSSMLPSASPTLKPTSNTASNPTHHPSKTTTSSPKPSMDASSLPSAPPTHNSSETPTVSHSATPSHNPSKPTSSFTTLSPTSHQPSAKPVLRPTPAPFLRPLETALPTYDEGTETSAASCPFHDGKNWFLLSILPLGAAVLVPTFLG